MTYGFVKVAAAIPKTKVADCIYNTIEIEKKYHFSDEAVFQDVLAYLKTRDDVYSFDKSPAFEQVDSYYDTPDKLVESAKSTLRIRHKDCNYEITIKCPN